MSVDFELQRVLLGMLELGGATFPIVYCLQNKWGVGSACEVEDPGELIAGDYTFQVVRIKAVLRKALI